MAMGKMLFIWDEAEDAALPSWDELVALMLAHPESVEVLYAPMESTTETVHDRVLCR